LPGQLAIEALHPKSFIRSLASEVLHRRPSLKVLYTSGYSQSAMIHDGRLEAGVLLLAKPYRKVDLAKMIRTALVARRKREFFSTSRCRVQAAEPGSAARCCDHYIDAIAVGIMRDRSLPTHFSVVVRSLCGAAIQFWVLVRSCNLTNG
jgi:hypothetical protein